MGIPQSQIDAFIEVVGLRQALYCISEIELSDISKRFYFLLMKHSERKNILQKDVRRKVSLGNGHVHRLVRGSSCRLTAGGIDFDRSCRGVRDLGDSHHVSLFHSASSSHEFLLVKVWFRMTGLRTPVSALGLLRTWAGRRRSSCPSFADLRSPFFQPTDHWRQKVQE